MNKPKNDSKVILYLQILHTEFRYVTEFRHNYSSGNPYVRFCLWFTKHITDLNTNQLFSFFYVIGYQYKIYHHVWGCS